MGEAFDPSGQVLGKVVGATKREVFDELISKFPDAHEVRIRSLGGAEAELPRYKCHKEVHALLILRVVDSSKPGEESDGSRLLEGEGPFAPIRVTAEWVARHKPQAPGYYVVYDDGYVSWSPVKAFEEGYTRIS